MKEVEMRYSITKKDGTDLTTIEMDSIQESIDKIVNDKDYTSGGYFGMPRPQYMAPRGSSQNPIQQNIKKTKN